VSALSELKPHYDVLVIGGGVHGAATALEAARLGYGVLLVEQGDFCSGTSANSLKIIHGGLRYLQSLDLRRSRESAREQSRLLRCAPQLVEPLSCLMATQRSLRRGRLATAIGLWFYDHVIRLGLPAHPHGRLLSPAEAERLAGRDLFENCSGAALWHDARVVDTERLVLTYLKNAERAGARICNYVSATQVHHDNDIAVALHDGFTGARARITADAVIDTGSFLDPHPHWVRAVNLVLEGRLVDCAVGLRSGSTGDSGRLFFATPLRQATIVGTWYFPDREQAPHRLTRAELGGCMADVRRLFSDLELVEADIARIHLGRLPVNDPARPLSLLEKPVIRAVGGDPRVVNLTGVKYTTAGPTAAKALRLARLPANRRAGQGRCRPWYGATESTEAVKQRVRNLLEPRLEPAASGPIVERLCRQYGAVALDIVESASRAPNGFERIPGCDAIDAEIHYCIEHEHCRTLSDFVLRRSGLGALSAPPPAAVRHCADVMGRRFDWTQTRVDEELDRLSAGYEYVCAGL